MRMIPCDIAHSGELHKLYLEFCQDKKLRLPTPDIWLKMFGDPDFFCLMFKHGKRPTGFLMGNIRRYYSKPVAELSTVFVRRAMRGKIRPARKMIASSKEYLDKVLNIQVLAYTKQKPKERAL